MDCAALTSPSIEPCGLPKYDCHCYVVSIRVVNFVGFIASDLWKRLQAVHKRSIIPSYRGRQERHQKEKIEP